jgi:hypothetical protein
VTTFDRPPHPRQPAPIGAPRGYRKGSVLADWLSSTDHKVIGHLYLITSFFFLVAGLMAMIMQAQLWEPGSQLVSDQQYNELFTMHGAIMLLLFVTPLFVGFANKIMPLQIGAPGVAFPAAEPGGRPVSRPGWARRRPSRRSSRHRTPRRRRGPRARLPRTAGGFGAGPRFRGGAAAGPCSGPCPHRPRAGSAVSAGDNGAAG